ncbi:MAG: YerC/YecD family TrpR-related protein [Clostridiales bacterium]|nr:YerC/YecD family TrpR-related protein [Clostridiales bacterium]
MGKNIHTPEVEKLFEGITCLETVEECYAFFEDLCTVSELLSLGQRFEVANMLLGRCTYNEVAERTGASTATISRVNRCLNYGADGYELVIERLRQKEEKKQAEQEESKGLQ